MKPKIKLGALGREPLYNEIKSKQEHDIDNYISNYMRKID